MLSVHSLLVTSCLSAAHFPGLTFLTQVLPLRLAPLAIILRRRPALNLTECYIKKNVLQCAAFPGKSRLLSQTLGGPVVSFVCGFIRHDNLQAWCQLSRNLYKRKSRI